MYRAAQEAVTNVRKHSGARSVEIAMTRTDAMWRLRIADDGRGAGDGLDRGFGITGIRERVAGLGGRVEISTGPGGGFALTLELPTTPAVTGVTA
jgi:signal transduction histidine kinase